jgi:hypothetical protein
LFKIEKNSPCFETLISSISIPIIALALVYL